MFFYGISKNIKKSSETFTKEMKERDEMEIKFLIERILELEKEGKVEEVGSLREKLKEKAKRFREKYGEGEFKKLKEKYGGLIE